LSGAFRSDALPLRFIFEEMIGRLLLVRLMVGNTQAIAAVRKGYSKKLRHLQRAHRVAVGVVHELLVDDRSCVVLEHCPTAEQKADLFT